MFLKSIEILAHRKCVTRCTADLVATAVSAGGCHAVFFPDALLLRKGGSCVTLAYSAVSSLEVRAQSGEVSVSSGGAKISYKTDDCEAEADFFRAIADLFCGQEFSPRFMQDASADFCGIRSSNKMSSVQFLLALMQENPDLVRKIFARLSFESEK